MDNKRDVQKLVGLKYAPGEGLPRVIVKSSGKVAEEILAQRPLMHGPKVIKDKNLVDKLYRLPVDAEISKDTFYMVAIILTHIFAAEDKLRQSNE